MILCMFPLLFAFIGSSPICLKEFGVVNILTYIGLTRYTKCAPKSNLITVSYFLFAMEGLGEPCRCIESRFTNFVVGRHNIQPRETWLILARISLKFQPMWLLRSSIMLTIMKFSQPTFINQVPVTLGHNLFRPCTYL